jgi:hypothetical protein
VIQANEREALVILGKTDPAACSGNSGWLGDAAHLSTKKGNVVVGIYGEDNLPEKPGFWQKAFSFLHGE